MTTSKSTPPAATTGLIMEKDFLLDGDSARVIVNLDEDTVLQVEAATHHPLQGMLLYLPIFQGPERVCWDCKGDRYLMLAMTLKGRVYSWTDICDPFDDTSAGAARVYSGLGQLQP
jgi:hypothetical protein